VASVVGIGNPLWDVFAPAAANPAAAEAAAPGAAVHIDAARMSGLLAGLHDAVWVPGGGARNALAVLSALGHRTYLVGAVGDDARGEGYRRALSADGIADCLSAAGGATGVCLTLTGSVPAERGGAGAREAGRVIVAPGAAAGLASIAGRAPRGPDIVIVEGFLAAREGLAREAVAYAARAGARLAVDLGHPGVASEAAALAKGALADAGGEAGAQGVRQLLLFATEAEVRAAGGAAALLGPPGGRRTGIVGAAGATPVTVCVKRGAAGASVTTREGEITCPAAEPAASAVLETTGAGDVFAGAFLAAWTAGRGEEDCCRFATRAAALSLGRYGGRLGTEEARELLELFARPSE
jgi:sugar/nucleoside kinase (ribokinase family)